LKLKKLAMAAMVATFWSRKGKMAIFGKSEQPWQAALPNLLLGVWDVCYMQQQQEEKVDETVDNGKKKGKKKGKSGSTNGSSEDDVIAIDRLDLHFGVWDLC
jgi:hypothetical protein